MRLPRVEDLERWLPRPEDFDARARGPATTSRVGAALGIAFAVCFLTGLWSHAQYSAPGWLPIGPDPVWLYRVTQGVHVTTGLASIPLLLVKMWSVYPRLFARPPRPPRALVLHLLERGSIGVLVASAFFQLATGALNIAQWYPWEFGFRTTHEAFAWIAVGSLMVHVAVKMPVIAQGLATPLTDEPTGGEPGGEPTGEPAAAPTDADPDGLSRRAVLGGATAATGLAVLLTAGQSVPLLRHVSVFAVRDGEGPQGLPVNRTARAAGATEAARDPSFVLEVVAGDTRVALTRAELAALPQRTHRLPVACVEGWSRDATWTGVAVRDLVALVHGGGGAAVRVRSLQTRGAFARSELPPQFVDDPRTLLALELNGETLSLDHGYPCRIIAPNRPGVLQTKWVRELEVLA